MDRPDSSLEAVLVFLEGENTGSEIKISSPKEFMIGRSEQCDIFIGEKKVSRKHAKLIATKEGLFIEDLESTNGTFVDGKKVTSTKINDGESVRIGMTVFQVNIMEGRALSNGGELVSDPKPEDSRKMTVESEPAEIPLEPEQEYENSLDVQGQDESSLDAQNPTMEKNPELDIPLSPEPQPQESSVSQAKKKPLSGDLSEMALPDILQMLKNNQRSGSLVIERRDEQGSIYFRNGELIGAEIGEASDLKAVYRMLSFNDGTFELQSVSDSFLSRKEQKIDLPLENILLEGMRQIDELEKIKKGLPDLDVNLELNKDCDSPLSKLHPKVLDILQLIIKHGEFSKVMDKSPLSDLETGKIVFYLIKKGYVAN